MQAPLCHAAPPPQPSPLSNTRPPLTHTHREKVNGALGSLSLISGASYFHSPCIRSSAASGAIADIESFTPWSPTSQVATATQAVLGGTWGDATFGGKKVFMAETAETTALGVSEYMVFVASLFNKEAAAAATFATLASRYACTSSAAKAATAAAAKAPRVLWAYAYPQFGLMRKWYVASCPNWYCSLVSDAGGALLLDAAGRSALNELTLPPWQPPRTSLSSRAAAGRRTTRTLCPAPPQRPRAPQLPQRTSGWQTSLQQCPPR